MRILIIYPAVSGLKNGNLVTAERWGECFSELGHDVEIAAEFDGEDTAPDLMIALHAVKSASSIEKCKLAFPSLPVVVALTGTDIYNPDVQSAVDRSLSLADRIVVLQSATAEDVAAKYQEKVRVIFQSITALEGVFERSNERFDVCVVGHLRPVKDPFQAAYAADDLPRESTVRVTQIGGAMTDAMRQTAEQLMLENSRYRWIGDVSREVAMERIARSHLLVNSSKVEGGAAVICEAVVAGTPILATRIAGNVGFLGEDYEGLFGVGETEALRRMLLSAEGDADFYQRLQQQCKRRRHLFEPDFERETWAKLLAEF